MSFEALKARQSEAWSSAPWEPMAARFAAMHDHLVARLAPRRGEHWLDVGTGTGAVALRAARAGAHVTGVDLSPVMVDTARRLAGEHGLGVRFEVGDAESLPYEDASFDVVASALGVFLAPDHAAAGRELARVCRPGGRLGVVAWQADPEAERMHAPFWPAREPGAGDRRDWGREEYVAELLGPEFELEFEEGELRLTAGSGEDMWRLFTSYDGAAKAQVDSLAPQRAVEYRRAYIAHHERHRTNGRISLPRRYLVTLGRRRGGSGPSSRRHPKMGQTTGRIEQLPVAQGSADRVISNGVIKLAPDIVSEQQLKESIVCDADLWASCIGGAAQEDTYRQAIEAAGLRVEEIRRNPYDFISNRARDASAKYGVKSVSLVARKEP